MTRRRALSSGGVLVALFRMVPGHERRRLCLLLALAVLLALAELALAGMVALLAAVFASPEAVWGHDKVAAILLWFGVPREADPRRLGLGILLAIVALMLAKNLLTMWQQWQLSTFKERVALDARGKLFRFFLCAPWAWLAAVGPRRLGFWLGSVQACANAAETLVQVLTGALMVLTLLAGLVSVSPGLSLLFMGGLAATGTLLVSLARRMQEFFARKLYAAGRRMNRLEYLALHGIKEMRLYGREGRLLGEYAAALAEMPRTGRRLGAVNRLPVYTLEVLAFAGLAGIMAYLFLALDAGMARIGGVIGFLAAAAWRALPVVNRLLDGLTSVRGLLPNIEEYRRLQRLERRLAAGLFPLEGEKLPRLHSGVAFRDVSYTWPSAMKPALDGVTLSLPAGKMTGIIGASGSGKSTPACLLSGLLPPDAGNVLVDGVPLGPDKVRGWMPQVGYVTQSPYLLDATLAENVALSRWGEPVDRERVLECCRLAALDFLDELAAGMDTRLGEHGARLSGGQAQRVAIARALYSRPALIIFDEATSALDQKNENAVYETILSLREAATMVVIAHRLRTIEGCDQLIWLEKGRVRMTGTPGEVLPAYRAAMDRHMEEAA